MCRRSWARAQTSHSEVSPLLPFFTAGKKFRVPMYLATSFDGEVAYRRELLLSHLARASHSAGSQALADGIRQRRTACSLDRASGPARRDVAEVSCARALSSWPLSVTRRRIACRYRCKHVNLVEKTNVQGEEEFLFAPYSVFTVLSVTMPASGKANASNPIVIELQAAVDNREEPEDLPLSPWN